MDKYTTPTFILPIYLNASKKKRVLVWMNGYRNRHFQVSNKLKREYHEIVLSQYKNQKRNRIHIHYRLYLQRRWTDWPNVRSIVEKFFLDGLVKCKAIVDDSPEYVVSDSSEYHYDKSRPRVEVFIFEKWNDK